MRKIWADQALVPDGWRSGVAVAIDDAGCIAAVETGLESPGEEAIEHVGILLPAPTNLHSHAFQRAMAGMTERRGPDARDTFWTWRRLMYRFLDVLTPDDIEAIAAFVQMEMLEAGYAASVEFHYLHHRPDGTPYADLAELSVRIAAAAGESGIGLTLLPVLYQQGGCDGRPLVGGQLRFGNDPERYARLFEGAEAALKALPADARIGVAPHSLRAVNAEGLAAAVALAGRRPVHIHAAEQVGEVTEVEAAMGARPVEWLLENQPVGPNWCFIHATQMEPEETKALADSRAVAGLCPITESSLGDGIFDAVRFLDHGGLFGIGSDSNIRIALSEELRTLEYSQRLRERARAILATPQASTGRVLFSGAVAGGARAGGRPSGAIEVGRLADLVALDRTAIDLEGRTGDEILDAWIFAADDRVVSDVWSAGRHVISCGRHANRDAITKRYRETVATLRERV